MVQRKIKIPKHSGPDGQGLPRIAFDSLLVLLKDTTVTDVDAKIAIELCLSASTQTEWNDIYRIELMNKTGGV